jgi:16S rRNA (guanine966-N2)-methyltransferase
MRVVAGTARGRRLEAPAGRETRPTTDRVREALFNALGSLDVVEGADVLDLFAGTGALVARNLAATGLAGRAEVHAGPAERFAADQAAAGRRWDLALLDPPYAYDGWDDLLAVLPADVAVIESDREVAVGPAWRVVRAKRYGTTLVAVARAVSSPRRAGPDEAG